MTLCIRIEFHCGNFIFSVSFFLGYSHELIDGSLVIRNQYTGEVPKKLPFIVNKVPIELMASATGKWKNLKFCYIIL